MDLLSKCIPLLIGGLIAWALWRAAQPQPLFVIRIVKGKPLNVAGRVNDSFLELVREIAAANRIDKGEITGYPRAGLIRLTFSPEFPAGARQQMRNCWVASGAATLRSSMPRY